MAAACRTISYRMWAFVALVVPLGWPFAAMGIGAFHPNREELALLPPYCVPKARRNGNDSNVPDVRKWMDVLGEGYIHIHHYCAALLDMHRADAAVGNQAEVNGLLKSALENFDYLQERLPDGYMLNPEIFTMKGKLLIRMHRGGDGIQQFQKAIELNKKYVPAYTALYDYYFFMKDLVAATKVLDDGLVASPNSKALLRRKKELSGAKHQ